MLHRRASSQPLKEGWLVVTVVRHSSRSYTHCVDKAKLTSRSVRTSLPLATFQTRLCPWSASLSSSSLVPVRAAQCEQRDSGCTSTKNRVLCLLPRTGAKRAMSSPGTQGKKVCKGAGAAGQSGLSHRVLINSAERNIWFIYLVFILNKALLLLHSYKTTSWYLKQTRTVTGYRNPNVWFFGPPQGPHCFWVRGLTHMGGTHKQHAYFGGLHSCAGPYSESCLENAGDTD